MSFDNIPIELRDYHQWVVWKYDETAEGKPTKPPYQAVNPNKLASVTDATQWASYDQAVTASSWANGIGFVVTADCPYTFIDLDESTDPVVIAKQKQIYETFQTYSEFSPSGNGLHLIVRGKVPHGRRYKKIEIYPSGRFMTVTGNVYQMARPIVDRQEMLTTLFEEMGQLVGGQPISHQGDAPQTVDDNAIYTMAMAAANGARFEALWNGRWSETIDARTGTPYASQSEADLALMNMLGFYSQNAEQMTRMFHTSGLGKREKAKRQDYLGWMISKAFDKLPPPIDLDLTSDKLRAQVTESVRAELVAKVQPALPMVAAGPYSVPPPGLVGRIANWCYIASPRPVPEIALAAAIAFMSGICARQYNVSSTGLNQYIALIGTTGVGKEAMASSIDRLMSVCMNQAPGIMEFRGPAEIASGQALVKYLEDKPCCFSIIGEFGYKLQLLSSDRANSADIMLKRILLDLYGKSGSTQAYYPMIYADASKNTGVLYAPAFTLLCEGTPKTFYANVNERMIEDGLLPRFTVIEYLGKRVPTNPNAFTVVPSPELIQEICDLVVTVGMIFAAKKVCNVEQTPEAKEFTHEFDLYCDAQINNSESEVTKQLWTRAYLKALKMAAIIAVGVDRLNPMITLDIARWAKGLILHEVKTFIERFDAGEMGSAAAIYGRNETAQVREIAKVAVKYLMTDYSELKAYKTDVDYHVNHIIPYSYLLQRCSRLSAFANDRLEVSITIKRSLQYLVDVGVIVLLNTRSPAWRAQWGTKGAAATLYFVADFDKLKEMAGKV